MLNLTISISESNHTNTPSSPIQRTMPKLSFGSTTNSNNSNNNSNNNTNNANNASLSNPLWEPPHLKTPTQVKIVSPPVKETNNLPTPVTPTPSPPAVIVTEEGFLKPVTVISQAEQDLKNGERELMQADKFMLGMGVERNYEFAFNHYSVKLYIHLSYRFYNNEIRRCISSICRIFFETIKFNDPKFGYLKIGSRQSRCD